MFSRLWLTRTSRRRFLRRSPPFFVAYALTACGHTAQRSRLNQAQTPPQEPSSRLSPTPACGDGGPTPSQTPGPFYTPNSPLRQSLLTPDTAGVQLIVTGQVLTTECLPLANSLIDVWHTDSQGAYDNDGNNLRGHQFTDAEGRYWLETIIPGAYPGRTRHLHVKVQAPDRPMLTTQLYFPQEPLNERDFLFEPALLMTMQETAEDKLENKLAHFDFVIG